MQVYCSRYAQRICKYGSDKSTAGCNGRAVHSRLKTIISVALGFRELSEFCASLSLLKSIGNQPDSHDYDRHSLAGMWSDFRSLSNLGKYHAVAMYCSVRHPRSQVWQPLILAGSHVVQARRSFDLATRRLRYPTDSAD